MTSERVAIRQLSTSESLREQLVADVARGFRLTPKYLPPKYFYDLEGSNIFERITELPEYYVTRAEAIALEAALPDLAAGHCWHRVVELGSGSSTKTRSILDALHVAAGTDIVYAPIDISGGAIAEAAGSLTNWASWVSVDGCVGDFLTEDLESALGSTESAQLVLFLGSTLGNLFPEERRRLLSRLSSALKPDDRFLVGLDLIKSPAIIEPAYNDSAGVTEEFNKNVIRVLQRELGASCAADDFRHHAPYVPSDARIEMRLHARHDLTISFTEPKLPDFSMAAGEYLLTEISQKFERVAFESDLGASGLTLEGWWVDPRQQVALALARAALGNPVDADRNGTGNQRTSG